MRTLVTKIGHLRKVIENQRGEFILFALVLPEEAIVWDVLASAKWIDEDQSVALRYIVKQVQSVLTKQELLTLSGILLFDSNKFVEDDSAINSETGWEENDIDFYGRHVQKAYVFAAPVEDFHVSLN